MLLEREIYVVRGSYSKIAPIADDAAALFYRRLFELDPSLRPLFKSDLTEQGTKLMHTLGLAIGALTKLEALTPVLEEMGKRHLQYGVETAHYDTVGEALLWTLEQGLGDAFDEETRAAWTKVYGILAEAMQRCYVTQSASVV